MNTSLPFSPACERNKDVILALLKPYFSKLDSVLEIGSGTAQHAVHFAQSCSRLRWQCSDQTAYLDGVTAQLNAADLNNCSAPIEIDVNQTPWLNSGELFDGVYTANTLHIMREAEVMAFFDGLEKVLCDGGHLFVYGPFKYKGAFTSNSNAEFDASLRARGVGSAIRNFEDVDRWARKAGFTLLADHSMPANNQCLIWQRQV